MTGLSHRETSDLLVVTDCCGQLLPESQTLTGDVHYPDLCPACIHLDGREHDSHVTCKWGCPGRDWSYRPSHDEWLAQHYPGTRWVTAPF